MAAHEHLNPNLFKHEEEDGPYCSNCTDDIEEVLEWNDPDRKRIHPLLRVPCVNCGAI